MVSEAAKEQVELSRGSSGQNLDHFPNLKRWHGVIKARPATQRAYARAKEVNPAPRQGAPSEEERKILFGQDRSVVK